MRAASAYMEVRHVAGLKGNSWSVNDDEFVSSLAVGEFRPTHPVIFSNLGPLVTEHQSIFDALWARGEPLDERRAALSAGTDLADMEVIRDPRRAAQEYLSLARSAKSEVLLLFPTSQAFRRDDKIGMLDVLQRRASSGVAVKILVPVDPEVSEKLSGWQQASGGGLSFRPVLAAEARETVTILVVDRSVSFTLDEHDPSQEEFEKAFSSALVAAREPRVRQNIRLFDRVWKETELREREEQARRGEEASRRRAELMQDILTHDIRNFNQVARLNAELLGDRIADRELAERVAAILRAVDGST